MANKNSTLARRRTRVRRSLKKRANGRPRLSVFRSSKNISVQIIDDVNGRTLCSASSLEKDLKSDKNNVELAQTIGKAIAERAKKAKIEEVIFDRGGYLFHGRVKALADAAREGGLKF